MSEEPETIDIQPVEFKQAPKHRRSAYSLLIGSVAVVIIPVVLVPLGIAPAFMLMLGVYVPVALIYCFWIGHWRLRVDNEGVHRRVLFKWQSWPWRDFAQGHVLRERDMVTFTFLDSAIGDGEFSLMPLADEDRKRVLELVNGMWQAPPMPETAFELHVRVLEGLRILGEIHLTSGKIETEWDGRIHAYRWEELRGVSLERTTHFQQGFERLCLSLPDKDLELRGIRQKDSRHPNWVGAGDREIVAFLMKHFPQEKFQVAAIDGPVQSLADFDARLARIEERLRVSRKAVWIVVGAVAAFGVWLAVKALTISNPLEDLPPALKVLYVVTVLLALVPLPVVLLHLVLNAPRTFRKCRREVEAERERFLEDHGAEVGESNVIY